MQRVRLGHRRPHGLAGSARRANDAMHILIPLIFAGVVAFLVDGLLKPLGLGIVAPILALATWVVVFFLAHHYFKELLE